MLHPDRYDYSPIIDRPRLVWPNNARLALWVVPNIEFYEYQPTPLRGRDPFPRMPHPDVLAYGLRDYGNRVGFWRLLEVLDRYKLRCTNSLNIAVYRHFPEIMQACEERQWDVMCHGLFNTRYFYDLSEEQERAEIQDCIDGYRALTGRDFTGWFSPADSGSLRTPDLVAEAGLRYIVEWYHDDQPFPMKVRNGNLVSLPYAMDVNDGWNFRLNIEGEEYVQSVIDQFDRLYREGEQSGMVFCLPVHPYVLGQPHRIGHLDRLLDYILKHDGIWQATGAEIADWYTANHLPKLQRHLAERGGP